MANLLGRDLAKRRQRAPLRPSVYDQWIPGDESTTPDGLVWVLSARQYSGKIHGIPYEHIDKIMQDKSSFRYASLRSFFDPGRSHIESKESSTVYTERNGGQTTVIKGRQTTYPQDLVGKLNLDRYVENNEVELKQMADKLWPSDDDTVSADDRPTWPKQATRTEKWFLPIMQ